MAFKSPGIYFTEIDNTEYTNPTAEINTTVAIIGFAKKGPIGVPTEITSYNEYKSIFGSPITGMYSGLAVRSILAAGGTVLYTRIADETLASNSSVVLKTSKKKEDGILVVNSKSNITVGTEGFKNKTVYTGILTSADKENEKTLVLRSPTEGKFQLNEILKQLNTSLKENYGFVEYKLNNITNTRRCFNIVTSGKKEDGEVYEKTYGPYFVSLYTKEDGESIAESLNLALSNGTTPYQKMTLTSDTAIGVDSNEEICAKDYVFSVSHLGLNEQKFLILKKNENESAIRFNSIGKEKITVNELVDHLNSSLENYGISVEYCWDVDVAKGEQPYLLFLSTDNTNFTIYPYSTIVDNKQTISDKSLFYPIIEDANTKFPTEFLQVVNNDYKWSNGAEFDIENHLLLNWEVSNIKQFDTEDDLPAVVSYNSDINSLIFTINKNKNSEFVLKGSGIKIKESEVGRYYLFTNDYNNASSDDAIEIARVSDNKGNVGSKVFETKGELESKLVVKRNSDGQIYFYQEGMLIPPTITNLSDEKMFNSEKITELFGEVFKQEEFEANNLKLGEYRCLIEKQGNLEVSATKNDMVIFSAKQVGSGTTDIGIEIYTSYSPFEKNGKLTATHYIDLYVGGTKKESWEDVSYNRNDENYFETLINKDPDNGGSAYVSVKTKKVSFGEELNVPDTAEITASGIVYLGMPLTEDSVLKTDDIAENAYGLYDYSVGKDGIPNNTNDLFVEAMDKYESGLSNKDLYSWHILITPDNITQEVQTAATELCEYMDDAIYIADPPQGLSRKAVINWHNGKHELRDTPFDSNFVCTYWPWCKVYDASIGEFRWTMPSVIMAAQFCKVDKNYAPWYAPAGETNGYLSTVIDIEATPNKTDRDALYLEQNRVNPLLKLRNGNILAYGEKTTQRKNSTLTKIHTRRMLVALKKELRAAIKGFIFQPTAAENISTIRANVQAIMESYKAGGGVASYKVICDGTNNTTETLQQDILNIAISCVPVGCFEQVEITFTLNKNE